MGVRCMTQGTQTGVLWQSRGVGWGGKWEGDTRERGHMIADSCWCLAETNEILQSSYRIILQQKIKNKKMFVWFLFSWVRRTGTRCQLTLLQELADIWVLWLSVGSERMEATLCNYENIILVTQLRDFKILFENSNLLPFKDITLSNHFVDILL